MEMEYKIEYPLYLQVGTIHRFVTPNMHQLITNIHLCVLVSLTL